MALTLYSTEISPPCRAVLMTSKALGLSLNVKEYNLLKGGHLTPEFLKLNPQHTVPTLEDGEVVLTNSHAISIYLVEKYGQDDTLYPKDIVTRALINQRLFFDEGTVFSVLYETMRYTVVRNVGEEKHRIPELNKVKAKVAYEFLEAFLESGAWVAGGTAPTIADLHLATTVTTLDVLIPFEQNKHPNILRWLEKCRGLSYYSESGLVAYKETVLPLLADA
ncbi:Glutathione S-transferase [Oryctes borbonicus]|uniref:Glutathione S-transferase n=1 Tax=Oryctes borbonicus TaxID=1629725 RepID=A0A0T6BC69_9SCAR|nr:Glutathione S-transferase [Oryctes borbonicus]